MKKRFIVPAICLLLIVSTAFFVSSVHENKNIETTKFYVGVTFCGNTTTEAKMPIDRVKDFTNLFVPYSGPVSKNETAMTEICEYAVAADLNII